MSLAEIISRTKKPVTLSDIEQGLQVLELDTRKPVLCHSSLSSFGWVCGGSRTLLQAIENAVGIGVRRGGTLVMPAQSTELSAPMLWSDPPVPEQWWQTIIDSMPAFDAEETPSDNVGAVAELFRTRSGSLRSYHPQVSFCARGRDARKITRRHSLDFGLGNNSPLGVLYEMDANILMAGSPWESCTAIHLAEHRCDWMWKAMETERAPVYADAPGFANAVRRLVTRLRHASSQSGMVRVWKTFNVWNLTNEDFELCGTAFEVKNASKFRSVVIGNAVCKAVSLRGIVDFAVEWLPRHRNQAIRP